MKDLTKKWLDFAKADLEAAEVLLNSGKTHWSYQLCVLHCHQAIEKILKTIIVENGDEVKKVHNLIFLLEESKLKIPKEFNEFIENLNPHYQPARYPDIFYKGPIFKYTKEMSKRYFTKTKKIFLWIEKKMIL